MTSALKQPRPQSGDGFPRCLYFLTRRGTNSDTWIIETFYKKRLSLFLYGGNCQHEQGGWSYWDHVFYVDIYCYYLHFSTFLFELSLPELDVLIRWSLGKGEGLVMEPKHNSKTLTASYQLPLVLNKVNIVMSTFSETFLVQAP